MIILKKGNTKYLKNYIPICLLSNIYQVLTKAREDIRRKLATRTRSWIQNQVLNVKPHPRRKQTKGEVQIILYPILHRIAQLRESLRLSATSSSTDIASRAEYIRCAHRTPEGYLHKQLDDNPPTQRKQQLQHHERSTTGRYHIANAVYGSPQNHIPGTDLGNLRHEDRRRIS